MQPSSIEDLRAIVSALELGAWLNSSNDQAYVDGRQVKAALDELAALRAWRDAGGAVTAGADRRGDASRCCHSSLDTRSR